MVFYQESPIVLFMYKEAHTKSPAVFVQIGGEGLSDSDQWDLSVAVLCLCALWLWNRTWPALLLRNEAFYLLSAYASLATRSAGILHRERGDKEDAPGTYGHARTG